MFDILMIAALLAGMGLLGAAFHYGGQFYPPGYGYEEERENNQKARKCFVAGMAAFSIAVISASLG